jgi:phosphoribosylaminoimidazole (AIR) synthetase
MMTAPSAKRIFNCGVGLIIISSPWSVSLTNAPVARRHYRFRTEQVYHHAVPFI